MVVEEIKIQKITNIERSATKILWFLVFIFAVFSVSVLHAEAASLIFSPSSGSYHQGENFTVSVLINTDQSANAVRGIVAYPTKYISVISVNYTNSIVDLWVRKPSFSNFGDSGNVTFEGVILNPGFTGPDGRIIDMVFRVKEQGSASVKTTDFAILANDGLGTNIAGTSGEANFIFTGPLPTEENKSMDEKITTIEEKVKKIEEQTKVINFVQEVNFYNRVNNLWQILPLWVKFIAIILIGVITMLLLLILGLIIVTIIWIWNHIRYRRLYIKFQLKRYIKAIRLLGHKILIFVGIAKKEVEGDIAYGYQQIRENIKETKGQLSLKILLKKYFLLLRNIVKRLFTLNYKPPKDDNKSI